MCIRDSVNPSILEQEAHGHAECRLINQGDATSTLHDDTEGTARDMNMRWIELRARAHQMPPVPRGSARQKQPLLIHDRGIRLDESQQCLLLNTRHAAREQLLMTASPVIALGLCDVWPNCTLIPDSVAEAQKEQWRLWCCLGNDAWPVFERKPMRTVDAQRRAALSFNEVTGVAAVELNGSALVPALEAVLRLLVRLRSAVRAVAIHISGNSWPSARLSARTLEQTYRALDALHGLGVPVVCSADDSICGAGSAAWSAADYRVAGQHLHAIRCGSTSEQASRPRERALQFAAWLAHHPAIGLKHMLSLTRQRLFPRSYGALPADAAARTTVLNGAGTRTEMKLLLAERSAQADIRIAPAPRPMSFSNTCLAWSTLAMLREIALGESAASPSVGANLCAIELYTPRYCASAATMEAHYGCSGMHTSSLHTEQYAACGEDEDAASMALTAMHRLLRRCGVRPAEVGVLHLGPSLLDRSKSIKTELMALVEAGDYADLEGVDHYGCLLYTSPSPRD